ncbi:MAG: hypothetical protein HFH47_00615 [Bacilli bacterium]|nr:hypothetical protein [Bacilli bacterium]
MDEKNNTMTIIIVVIVLLIAGLIAYFVFNNMQGNDTDVNEPTTNENDTLDDTSDKDVDVAGAYTGTYNKNTNVLEDAADAVTDNDSDRVVVELVLDNDGKATFVKSGDTDETIKGTYTTANDKVTLTADKEDATDKDDDNATTDKDSNKTYVFDINADGSLSYKEDSTSTDTVTLNKTDKSNLKHIK